jgi:hypothetical protein
MEQSLIQDAKTKLTEINDFISTLDSELKPKAISILLPLYFDNTETLKLVIGTELQNDASNDTNLQSLTNEQTFFTSFSHDKPAENVAMIAAWLYSQYGTFPITNEEIQDYASRLGITVAARSDNTMRQAKRDGKALFRQVGKGWEPTLVGETYFRETYKVRKGNKPHPNRE